jgi:hypothetical protein
MQVPRFSNECGDRAHGASRPPPCCRPGYPQTAYPGGLAHFQERQTVPKSLLGAERLAVSFIVPGHTFYNLGRRLATAVDRIIAMSAEAYGWKRSTTT